MAYDENCFVFGYNYCSFGNNDQNMTIGKSLMVDLFIDSLFFRFEY